VADDAGAVAFDPTGAVPVDENAFDPNGAKPVDASAPPRTPSAPPADPVDSSGLGFMDRVHLQMADNPEEKQLYLTNRYGKGNVIRKWVPDSAPAPGEAIGGRGQWKTYVKKDGKLIDVDGGGMFAPAVVADAPEMVGMAGGATVGAMYGSVVPGWGTLAGGIIGAGVGAMAGKGATELGKNIEGNSNKGALETANSIAKSGLEGMGGEVGGRMAGRLIPSKIGPLPKAISGATDESRAMTERVLEGGARPPSVSTMPDARKIQRIETLANKISGPSPAQQAANKTYVEKRVKSVLTKSGIPEQHADVVMRELDDTTSALSTKQVGAEVQDAVRAHVTMLEKGVEDSITKARASTDASIKHLNALSERYKPGDLGLDVAQGIAQARSEFATSSSKVYKQVDRITGGRALVPTTQMAREAQKLVAMIPESDAARAVVKKIADYPPFVSFEQAQRARTQLHELQFSSNLTPGATKHEYGRLADAVDRSFDMAKKLVSGDFVPPTKVGAAEDDALLKEFGITARSAAPANAEEMAASGRAAANMLDAADQFYSDGIKKFNDATINRLVQSARAGLPPDPNVIAKTIFQPGQEARVGEIRKLIGEQTFKRAAAVHWQENILSQVTAQDGTISGQKLYGKLKQQGKMLDAVYGAKDAADMRSLAETLSAIDGHLPPEKLQPGTARDLIASITDANKRLDGFMKENYLSALSNPQRTPEDAYRWIVSPGQTARLEEAVRFFGEQSPQLQGIRQAALRTLLNGTVTAATKGEGAKSLASALAQYTERQQKILFPNGLDEDLRLLGREIDFLFPREADQAMAGFTAGNVLEKGFFRRNWIIGKSAVLRSIVTQPSVIRALSIGLRGPQPARDAARHTLKELAYFGALELNDDDEDDNAQPAPGGELSGAGQPAAPVGSGNQGTPAGVPGAHNPASGGVAGPSP